jgi:transcriptional regulator of acetoin/glycerol metabolism
MPPSRVRPLTPEQQARREELCALLTNHRGNISEVARCLGKDRVQIRRWIKLFGISLDEMAH